MLGCWYTIQQAQISSFCRFPSNDTEQPLVIGKSGSIFHLTRVRIYIDQGFSVFMDHTVTEWKEQQRNSR